MALATSEQLLNAEVFTLGSQPWRAVCEWDPFRQLPARLSDPFHGFALTRQPFEDEILRVCRTCRKEIEQLDPRARSFPRDRSRR